MSVSIIMPAHRAEQTIARAVKSVLAQTRPDWEMMIVADDGQDYHAILLAQGMTDARLRFATTGRTGAGPGAARNIGLDEARYSLVAHLDADDAYAENYLSVMLPLALEHGACHSSCRLLNEETGREMPLSNMRTADMMLTMPHLMLPGIGYANIVIDRHRCSTRWPEDIHYGEDQFFWLLILDELPAIYYSAHARYDYYYRIGSLSRPDEKDTRGLCDRRSKMLQWIARNKPPIRNAANRDFIIRWLQLCNDVEINFNYTLLDHDTYIKAMGSRLEALIKQMRPT